MEEKLSLTIFLSQVNRIVIPKKILNNNFLRRKMYKISLKCLYTLYTGLKLGKQREITVL